MNYDDETFELRQLVIDAYQLHDRMLRLGSNLPALREWAERFHDISDLPEGEIGPTAKSEIDRLQAENERLRAGLLAASKDLVAATYEDSPKNVKEFVHYALNKLGDAINPPNTPDEKTPTPAKDAP